MAPAQNLLQLLQSRTIVDCDTMDVEVPKTQGQFVDCTSNQAIAYLELQKPVHKSSIADSIALGKTLSSKFPEVTLAELTVEIAMIKLQIAISYHVVGFVHVQTNPYYAYDTEKTVTNARRIVLLCKFLDSVFDSKRICVKIPSTWEGLQACKILQLTGITTLATTLFVMEQASLAGEVGCHYIAPYVNELKVHFEPGFVDNNKAQTLCLQAQHFYEQQGFKTQVLPASLTSTDEIMALAGVHHITIAPALLVALVAAPASSSSVASLFDDGVVEKRKFLSYVDSETKYRIAFTRSAKGEGERKLGQAINIFCDMQDELEAMVSQ